jgi:hypothetical protein
MSDIVFGESRTMHPNPVLEEARRSRNLDQLLQVFKQPADAAKHLLAPAQML